MEIAVIHQSNPWSSAWRQILGDYYADYGLSKTYRTKGAHCMREDAGDSKTGQGEGPHLNKGGAGKARALLQARVTTRRLSQRRALRRVELAELAPSCRRDALHPGDVRGIRVAVGAHLRANVHGRGAQTNDSDRD